MNNNGPSESIRMTSIGSIGNFLWRACEVGPRVIILALFASYFTYWLLIAAIVHWIGMSLWLCCQKSKFYETKFDQFVFNVTVGYISIFCFLNVIDGQTRFRVIPYYIVFYTQNFMMLLSCTYFTNDKSAWFHFVAISIVALGCLLHIIFQLSYYLLCHPKKNEIRRWLSPRKTY